MKALRSVLAAKPTTNDDARNRALVDLYNTASRMCLPAGYPSTITVKQINKIDGNHCATAMNDASTLMDVYEALWENDLKQAKKLSLRLDTAVSDKLSQQTRDYLHNLK